MTVVKASPAIVLIVAWAATLEAQNRGTVAGPSQTRAGGGIALIDLSYVFENHPGFKQQLESLKQNVQTFEQELKQQQQQISSQRQQIASYKPGSQEYKRLDEVTTKQLAGLRVKMELKRKDVMEDEARVYYETYNEVLRVVQAIAESRGLNLVLRFDRESPQLAGGSDPRETLKLVNRPVIYQRQLDISNLVIQELNRLGTARVPATGQRSR